MPAVTRIGDKDVFHCGAPYRQGGSSDVFANGIGISRQNDANTPHLRPGGSPCSMHSAGITTGSTTVFVNGRGCGRVGDAIKSCTSVAAGSPNVFAG